MSKYDLYRSRMRNEECCRLKYEAGFITEGTSATTILHVRLNTKKQAGLVINSSEGPDSATVYTYKDEVKTQELLKGDYFIWQDKQYFVYEDIDIVLQALYKKQLAYQCNVECKVDDAAYGGYFVSSLKRAVEQNLDKEISLSDKEKPMLVVPTFNWSKVGQTTVINGKPWRITEVDYSTNAGISYCSLELGWISKSDDADESAICAHYEDCLVAGQEIDLPTEDGYFAASSGVEIIDIQQTKVKIKIPFGIESVVISTKQEGEVVKEEYKVVIGQC